MPVKCSSVQSLAREHKCFESKSGKKEIYIYINMKYIMYLFIYIKNLFSRLNLCVCGCMHAYTCFGVEGDWLGDHRAK